MPKEKTIIRLPLDRLIAHPENPNRMNKSTFEKLKRHISKTHNYEPVIVRQHPTIEDTFEIINGHHRVRALRELGEGFADCVEWEVDDDQTRVLLATLNRLVGRDVLSEKISLIKNLSEKFDSKTLAKILPDTKAVIEKLKNMESQQEFEISDFKFQMPHSLVFFLDDEQMRIVEQAIEKAHSSKGAKAQSMAEAITKIAAKYLESDKAVISSAALMGGVEKSV
jgi:ParB-like chromosome segregation protein Spo0J